MNSLFRTFDKIDSVLAQNIDCSPVNFRINNLLGTTEDFVVVKKHFSSPS